MCVPSCIQCFVANTPQREAILTELIHCLIVSSRYREALDELELYKHLTYIFSGSLTDPAAIYHPFRIKITQSSTFMLVSCRCIYHKKLKVQLVKIP
jgi:hypothetical protein